MRRSGYRNLLIYTTNFLLLLVLVFFLSLYSYRGIFSRYLQDDYCYGAQITDRNFVDAQIESYTRVMPYNSDRFSLTLISGLAEYLGGPYAVPYLPALSILSWVAGLFLMVKQGQKAFHIESISMITLLVSIFIIFFSFALSPNLYQVLYWRSAMLPYLTPVVLNCFLLAFFFYLLRKNHVNVWQIIILGLGSFIAGGFSETSAFWQLSLWGFLLFGFTLKSFRNGFALKLLISTLIGTVFAILVMALCPANASQLSPFNRSDILTVILKSLFFANEFLRTSIRGMILPFFIIGCFGFFIGLQTQKREGFLMKGVILRIILMGLFCYLSVFAVMLPTMLAMSSYPGDRALFPAFVSLIVTIYSFGWIASKYLQLKFTRISNIPYKYVIVVFGILLTFYLARYYPRIAENLSAYRSRAEAWDNRNASIIAARERGETHINVPAFDSIAFILELYPNENFWVNVCAARYYRVDGISAIEGYNGIQPIFR